MTELIITSIKALNIFPSPSVLKFFLIRQEVLRFQLMFISTNILALLKKTLFGYLAVMKIITRLGL